MTQNKFFRTDVIRGPGVRINKEQNVIKGFSVVTKGITKDARGEFDDTALDTVVALGNEAKIGIKSRFGHPNMSSTALGTFLGRVKNFRREDDIVRADLYVDKTAFNTPDGDLGSYVMSLAKSDPDAFGTSMVIHWDSEKQKEKDLEGDELPPFIRVKKLFSIDVVDDPAANDGLFGMPFFSDSVNPSFEMTSFLDKFLQQPEAVEGVVAFLDRYRVNKNIEQTQFNKQEEVIMLENLTVDQLKQEKEDVFNAVHLSGFEEGKKVGVEEGAGQEKERTLSILKKAAAFKNMDDLAIEAVENSLSLDQAVIKFQEKQLKGLQKESPENPGPDGDEPETKSKLSHLEKAEIYKKEHSCSMTDALQATAEKRQ